MASEGLVGACDGSVAVGGAVLEMSFGTKRRERMVDGVNPRS